MKVAVISAFTDYHRRGAHHRGALQPQIGPLIAALLPDDAEVTLVNDTWDDPPWAQHFDLVLLSCLHSDFDRARQIAHWWRRRGALTVLGGPMASQCPALAEPWFDAVVVGDPESTVPQLYADAKRGRLQRRYHALPFDAARVPTPRVQLLAGHTHFPLTLEMTRGCPYTCEFCSLTAAGTRFMTRPPEDVARDLQRMQRALRGASRAWQRRVAVFTDNNIAGNLGHLRALCDALEPLGLTWASCATFNLLLQPALLARLFEAGCRALYVGLESFNPAALGSFNKPQNRIAQVQRALANAQEAGILITAGIVLSPQHDSPATMAELPRQLADCGLHVPSFVCFETPFPGTPYFDRLAREREPALLPHALLRDFNGYTLTVRPQLAAPDAFIGAYRELLAALYRPTRRLAKLAHDLPALLRHRRSWAAAAIDIGDMAGAGMPVAPGRTYLAGSDTPPPERVPFTAGDFDHEAHALQVLSPTVVTDEDGRLLPPWRPGAVPVPTASARLLRS